MQLGEPRTPGTRGLGQMCGKVRGRSEGGFSRLLGAYGPTGTGMGGRPRGTRKHWGVCVAHKAVASRGVTSGEKLPLSPAPPPHSLPPAAPPSGCLSLPSRFSDTSFHIQGARAQAALGPCTCACVCVCAIRVELGPRGVQEQAWFKRGPRTGSQAGGTLDDRLPLEPRLRQLFISFSPHRPILLL